MDGTDAIIAELKGLREDFRALASRVEAAESIAARAASAAENAATAAARAYEQANAAMRAASDNATAVSDAQAAMVRHAAVVTQVSTDVAKSTETVATASAAMVKSNQEQNPTIDATLELLVALKKHGPTILAAVAIVATALGTFVGTLVHAYLTAKGH
jgi:Mrp family chromosome partitioning ATPase